MEKIRGSRYSLLISFLCLFGITILNGCVTSPPLLGGLDKRGNKIYLTSINEIPTSIENFTLSHDIVGEEAAISYLLYRIQQSNLTFVRNGAHYNSTEAAEFLRWKLNRSRWRPLVRTADEFVVIITKGSVQSGESYSILLKENLKEHELKLILINELEYFRHYAKEKERQANMRKAIDRAQKSNKLITSITASKPAATAVASNAASSNPETNLNS